ncbi:MAG: hypothetical protein JWP75_4160 [Frondihabitans sp.]|nr:hypothetical protein [Frondihabitans sp.]
MTVKSESQSKTKTKTKTKNKTKTKTKKSKMSTRLAHRPRRIRAGWRYAGNLMAGGVAGAVMSQALSSLVQLWWH